MLPDFLMPKVDAMISSEGLLQRRDRRGSPYSIFVKL